MPLPVCRTSVVIIFAIIYKSLDRVDSDCGLGDGNSTIAFAPAFAFSLETCTTVGYGLPNGVNSFFEPECQHIQIAIYFQVRLGKFHYVAFLE